MKDINFEMNNSINSKMYVNDIRDMGFKNKLQILSKPIKQMLWQHLT